VCYAVPVPSTLLKVWCILQGYPQPGPSALPVWVHLQWFSSLQSQTIVLNVIYLAGGYTDAARVQDRLPHSCLPSMLFHSGIIIDASHSAPHPTAHPPCMFSLHAIATLADGKFCLENFPIWSNRIYLSTGMLSLCCLCSIDTSESLTDSTGVLPTAFTTGMRASTRISLTPITYMVLNVMQVQQQTDWSRACIPVYPVCCSVVVLLSTLLISRVSQPICPVCFFLHAIATLADRELYLGIF